jgi:hypothetical protein
MNNIENNKRLFYEVFSSKGKNSWTIAYKKQYIYTVQKQYELTRKELAENIVDKDTVVIFDTILKYDDNLSIFKQFLKSHELYARKSIEIHNFKVTDDELTHIQSLEDSAYNYTIPSGWTPIEMTKTAKSVVITLAKGAFHATNVKFEKDKLDSDTWDKLKSNVLAVTDNKYSTLTSIRTELMEETRVISKVKFDLETDTLEFGIDYSYTQEDGKKASQEQYVEDKEKITNEVTKALGFTDDRAAVITNTLTTQEDSIFTRKVFEQLISLKQNDLIIIPTTHHFYREDTVNDEHDEDIITSQKNQKLQEIEKKVKLSFADKGTLTGFFEEHPEHNTAKAKITEQLISSAETTKFHAYAILIRDITSFEKDLNNDKMKGKAVDSIVFEFDVNEKKINIKNNNYTKEIYETIISKVLEFSKTK